MSRSTPPKAAAAGKTRKPAATSAPKSAPRAKPAKSTAGTGAATTAPAPVTASTATPANPTAPSVVNSAETVVLGPILRKKELIDRVVERSGIKKKDAKPVVEAMLAELGEALAENRELVLPPFGKFKIKREKTMPNGRAMVVKVRQSAPSQAKLPDAAE
ncbi:HU family DNA-binding protein [Sulfitobacter sabulilitoris]|uniref:HU family DNA-binding protein n=1 Tax=Sulfitobacter sabulilitoris TaxID=2562655 RepID=A0A5S3PJ71_9RHOB|nr:HU family DNA-binding protein [Sulfitobacter sabulilitoris]TMM54387.1 HU family DNA-binding protein [Sulfitobacter sabulilitoris]